jgi:hypothetical protein
MLKRPSLLIGLIAICLNVVLAGGNTATDPTPFKSNTCRTDFGSYAVSDGSSSEVMGDFLRTHIPNLQNKQNGIQLTFSQSSPGGYHYTFAQTYAGIPVFSSDMVVNVSRKNAVYSIFDDSYDVSKWKVNLTDFNYQDVAPYQAYLKQYFSDNTIATAKQVIAYDESTAKAQLCYLVNLKDASGHQRDILVAPDKILYEHDACMHRAAPAAQTDSLVTGMVFRPDPLTTAHVFYYAPYMGHDSAYQNYNDSDTYQLNIQREQKSFNASYNAGTFSLQNQYVQLVQLGSGPPPVTSNTPAFNFTRSQTGFLDVMVYYHLNVIRNYVHDLGFNSADTLIMPDSHALTADDDFFSEPNNIYYGTGGVPDCQDADVIVHEYTHFISWNSNHSNGVGSSSQRNSIDEGSADYNGSSYSASIDTFAWYNMFTWDGHNEYWPGRLVNDPTVYPAIPTAAGLNGIYKYSVIWSSALMQIWFAIGRGPADSLFFQTLYGLGGNIVLPDAAQQYIKADSLLFNGKYHCTITDIFYQHGLAHDSSCSGEYPLGLNQVNTISQPFTLVTYPDGFKAVASQYNVPVDIILYDISGRQLASYQNTGTEIKPDLPTGIYIIDVSSQAYHQGFKWVNVK